LRARLDAAPALALGENPHGMIRMRFAWAAFMLEV
jgi:hypothetical protein